MPIRQHDMSEWYCHTHRFTDLADAINFVMPMAHQAAPYTPRVMIWPMKGTWIVIAYRPAVIN